MNQMKMSSSRKRALDVLDSALKALSSLKKRIPDLLEASKIIEARSGEIIITGIGKSGHIAQKISATFTSLGLRSVFLHPVEAMHGDIGVLSSGDIVVAISQSGESKEIIRFIDYARRDFGVKVVSITKSRETSLGKISDAVILSRVKKEGSPNNLAPMASTTMVLVIGDMLAAMLAGGEIKKSFARLHPGGSLGMSLTGVRGIMKNMDELSIVYDHTNAYEVFDIINKKALGIAAVVDKKNCIKGVITDGDIRRWLLEKKDPTKSKAADIMTYNPKTIFDSANLLEALQLMERHKITTIFVVHKNSKLVGAVHMHDIIERNMI